jgi:hypothetical protein
MTARHEAHDTCTDGSRAELRVAALVPPPVHPRKIREGFVSLACGIIWWRRLVSLAPC